MSFGTRKLSAGLSVSWVLIILIFSTISQANISVDYHILLTHVDKFVHFSMYFILQLLLMWNYHCSDLINKHEKIFLSVCFYGLALELIQYIFLKDRFFEIFDIIANITGAFVAFLFFQLFKT